MTDDTGIFQHAKYTVPDPSHGYTTDDNARALIMAVMLYDTFGCSKYLDLAYKYMHFLIYAKGEKLFRNFMGYDRRFQEKEGSEDCFGRCIWSLGYVSTSSNLPSGLRETADWILRETAAGCRKFQYIRGKAYTLLGLCCLKRAEVDDTIRELTRDIIGSFDREAKDGWRWFEDRISYCNAVIPLALLEAYDTLKEKRWLDIGIESLGFLLSNTFCGNVFNPVGCSGWLIKDGIPAEYDQQPVEACETLLACTKAYEITGDIIYLNRAESCFEWYVGKNIAGVSLIDPYTGGCMDGITLNGLNQNEGAESLVSWFIAWLTWNQKKDYWKREKKK
jgi:hypothetical protein